MPDVVAAALGSTLTLYSAWSSAVSAWPSAVSTWPSAVSTWPSAVSQTRRQPLPVALAHGIKCIPCRQFSAATALAMVSNPEMLKSCFAILVSRPAFTISCPATQINRITAVFPSASNGRSATDSPHNAMTGTVGAGILRADNAPVYSFIRLSKKESRSESRSFIRSSPMITVSLRIMMLSSLPP